MTRIELIDLAKTTAGRHGLDPALCCGIIEQESSWDTHAIRYEPAFHKKYVLPLNLPNITEATARSFSWGLMQVMGQVAREHGFSGRYLSELCTPEIGIQIGCKVFAAKLKRAQGDVKTALLFWNGGGNPDYPEEVLARVPKYISNVRVV